MSYTPHPSIRSWSATIRTLAFALLAAGSCTMAGVASAAEINSNGLGGGLWSEPSTWRGNQVPKKEDDVTIARGDAITFDRNDIETVSCNKLFIDPNGSLGFKTASGRITMVIADAIETYGSIKIDSGKVHGDIIELRMTGELQDQRTLTLMRGSSLTVAGTRFLEPKDATAIISTHPGKEGFTQSSNTMLIFANGHAAIDLHNARLDGVTLHARDIDNTGAFADQRLNIIGNYFDGLGSVTLAGCDTPIIADNSFINTSPGRNGLNVLHIAQCSLPTIRNNIIKNKASRGMLGTSLTDPLIQNNYIEGPNEGFYLQFCNNVMVQNNHFVNCGIGYYLRVRSGVVRDNIADACELPYSVIISNQQFINNKVINPIEGKPLLAIHKSTTILYNTEIQPENVEIAKDNEGGVTIAHQPLIVKVKGNFPRGTVVQVVPTDKELRMTEDYPPVVNSPASIDSQGLTAPMITGSALMVRSWQMFDDEKDTKEKATVPSYEVRVLGPESAPGKNDRKVLVSKTVTPDATWHRKDLADRSPIVELTLP